MRNTAREVIILLIRANNCDRKVPVLDELRIKLEELKVQIRICKEIRAFANFNSFETSINKVIDIARQNEGWMRSRSTKELKQPESPTDAFGLGT